MFLMLPSINDDHTKFENSLRGIVSRVSKIYPPNPPAPAAKFTPPSQGCPMESVHLTEMMLF